MAARHTPSFGKEILGCGTSGPLQRATRGPAPSTIGQVVGSSQTQSGCHAFLWEAGKGMRDLGTLGGSSSHAKAISENGLVVGQSACSDLPGVLPGLGVVYHAFLWQPGAGMQDLGPLPARFGGSE